MSSHEKNIYYPQLDALRFFAFLLVFIHHSPAFKSLPVLVTLHVYGWIGVDLFLCLSAFLFSKLLFAEYQSRGDLDVKKFYIRRLLRIWPLYFVFLGIIFVLTATDGGWNAYTLKRSLGMVTFTDNIFSVFWMYNPFFASGHLWTISYEEQFYAIIPWTLRKVFEMTHKAKVFFITIVFLVGMIIKSIFIYFRISHPAIWVLPITHFETILGGLIIGLGMFDKPLRKIPSFILLLLGVGALMAVFLLPNINEVDWPLLLIYPLLGIGMSLILHSSMTMDRSILKAILQNRVLTHLGKISYGLYVYHVWGLVAAGELVAKLNISPEQLLMYPLVTMTIGLGITIAVSLLSYQLLEKPFLKIKDHFALIRSRPV